MKRASLSAIAKIVCMLDSSHALPALPITNYLSQLQESISSARSNLTTITTSAERAAKEFLSGGNIWAAGRQEDFIAEACGRAGGLMAIAPLTQQTPGSHDVILYAVPGALKTQDLKRVELWREKGAIVVTFCSRAGLFDEQFPVDTVANIIELWTWTGEFVAACTRLEKMPALYQSYGLPGGIDRGKKYRGKKIHDDLTVKPVAAGVLGQLYLDQIDGSISRIQASQMAKILQAAKWWAEATSAEALVCGHMFPRHAQDSRAPRLWDLIAVPAWEDKELLESNRSPGFVLYLGYQFAPRKLLEQAKAKNIHLVYSDVQPAEPPEPANNILYIDPGWPLADGCVTVPGYDIPILPASGVIHAAIYWTIASERSKLTR
jgi:hypothetical protein